MKTLNKKILLKAAKKFGTPIYLYDANTIVRKCNELKKNFSGVNLYYACKANSNPEIVKRIYQQGFGIETVSPGEINIAREAGVPVSKILFTCGSIDENELVGIAKQGIRINLDSLHQVEVFGKNFPAKNISVRLNLRVGGGHHPHLITGGTESKFGVDVSQIEDLKNLAHKYSLKITGLHQHIGSNILDSGTLIRAMQVLYDTALVFPDLTHLDFGGGFGVPYKSSEKPLDLKRFSVGLKKLTRDFTKKYGREVNFSFEPGRYLVAEAGNLLVEVNDIKRNPKKTFIGVNSGMNHLIRPAMYDSHHEVINLSSSGNKTEIATVVGNICESGDVLAKNRMLALPKIGDILTMQNAGAYGYVMSSEYNSRPLPKEFLLIGDKITKI